MKHAWPVALLALCLAGCAWQLEPPEVERETDFWQRQAAAQDAANDEALVRLHEALAREGPAKDAAEQGEAEQYGVEVSAQQAALARLRPALQSCVATQVHALSRASTQPASLVASAVLAQCRPWLGAVARTVELAGISSEGLAADMAARLRPALIRDILLERHQTHAAAGAPPPKVP